MTTFSREHDYDDDLGERHHAELEVVATEPTPGTYWEPPDPGWIESMTLVVDGEPVTDIDGWRWLVDEMLATKPD